MEGAGGMLLSCTCPSELGLCLLLLPASCHAVSLTFSVGLIMPSSLNFSLLTPAPTGSGGTLADPGSGEESSGRGTQPSE